jgi:hypothetical protein
MTLQKARKPAAESTENGPSELVLLPGKNGSHGETQTCEQPKPAEHRIDIRSARDLRGSGRTVVGNETLGPCWARRHPLAKCRLPVTTARTDGNVGAFGRVVTKTPPDQILTPFVESAP